MSENESLIEKIVSIIHLNKGYETEHLSKALWDFILIREAALQSRVRELEAKLDEQTAENIRLESKIDRYHTTMFVHGDLITERYGFSGQIKMPEPKSLGRMIEYIQRLERELGEKKRGKALLPPTPSPSTKERTNE